jgi:putative membrane protein
MSNSLGSFAPWWQGSWNGDPLLWSLLLAAALIYARGAWTLWRRSRRIRQATLAYYGGLVVLVVALASPLENSAGMLFSAHMIQHMLLMMVAAPLLVLGRPDWVVIWSLPPARRRSGSTWLHRRQMLHRLWRGLTHPAFIWMAYIVAVLFWHIPLFYTAALANRWLHDLEHASMLGAALLYWWGLSHLGRRGGMSHGAAMLLVFSIMIFTTLLGALITFAAFAWYPPHPILAAGLWGITPLEDQQLAGLIMWIPGSPIHLALFLYIVAHWIRSAERRAERRELLARR